MLTLDKDIDDVINTSLTWNTANEKTSKEKKLIANSSIGVYSITWNVQDYIPVYDLYLQKEFIASDTAIKNLYTEAETHYEGILAHKEYAGIK